MNGKKVVFASIIGCVVIGLFQSRSKQFLSIYKKNPNIKQYLNRFVEFYDDENLSFVENQFLSMVDLGYDPNVAFSTLISEA